MKKKVLFLESKGFYLNIIGPDQINNVNFEFDGGLNYNDDNILKFDLVVYTIYSSYLFNFIVLKCKKLNIPTLNLFDGVAEFSNFRNNKYITSLGMSNYHPVASDFIGVVGDKAARYFSIRGCDVIKYMPYRISLGKNMHLPNNDKFLITTANTAYYNTSEYNVLLDVLIDVVSTLLRLQIDFKFRIYDKNIISDLKILPDDNLISGTFEDVLKDFTSVITTPSSISLTAMKFNRAVAQIQYRDYPHFFQSGWFILPKVNLDETILSMLNRDVDRMAFQAAEVSGNFDVESISDSIENISTHKYIFSECDKSKFLYDTTFKMLNSNFNFNFEYIVRKFYWWLKKTKLSRCLFKLRCLFIKK